MAVDFFFVLSGFVIGYAYDDRWDVFNIFPVREFTDLNGVVHMFGGPSYSVNGGWSLTTDQIFIGLTRLFYPFVCGLLISRILPLHRTESNPSGSSYHNPRTGLRTCFLIFNEGSTRIELMTHPDTVDADPTARCIGYTHLSIAVGSREIVNSLTGRLAADGYTVASQPRLTGDGYYESCIQGPDGIQIEITE